MATLEQAKMAKKHALEVLRDQVELVAVGICGSGDDYCLSAHLSSPASQDLPEEIDGVALTYKVVGRVEISGTGSN